MIPVPFQRRVLFACALSAIAVSLPATADTVFSNGGSLAAVTATVNGEIKVPNVLLLRVGAASGYSSLSFIPNITIPGGQSAWDGSALTSDSPSEMIQAFAYTNNGHFGGAGFAKLTCATTGLGSPQYPSNGAYKQDVKVAATSNNATALLNHPGIDLACATPVNIGRNTLYDAKWTYTLSGAAVIDSISGGNYPFSIGYTLTNY